MKKISVLLALIICVTIGGVYAAWIYSDMETTAVESQISHSMETATSTTAEGELHITQNTLNLIIDQTSEKDYTPVMKLTGYVELMFKPNPGATNTKIYEEAINVKVSLYTVDAETNLFYGDPIYKATDNTLTISGVTESNEELKWTKDSDGNFTTQIGADKIQSLFEFGGKFNLNTINLYKEFHNLEEKVVLKIKFEEAEHVSN